MITLAPFQPAHAAGVCGLILPIQQAEFGIPVTLADQPDLLDIPGFYQRAAGGFWVALDGDAVVGSVGLLDIGSAGGALRKMFVAATHRGREHGIAARLMETLLAHAQAGGLRRIHLGTTGQFRAAHRFYEKHGFVRIARDRLPAAFPVMAVDTRFYRRDVAPAAS